MDNQSLIQQSLYQQSLKRRMIIRTWWIGLGQSDPQSVLASPRNRKRSFNRMSKIILVRLSIDQGPRNARINLLPRLISVPSSWLAQSTLIKNQLPSWPNSSNQSPKSSSPPPSNLLQQVMASISNRRQVVLPSNMEWIIRGQPRGKHLCQANTDSRKSLRRENLTRKLEERKSQSLLLRTWKALRRYHLPERQTVESLL